MTASAAELPRDKRSLVRSLLLSPAVLVVLIALIGPGLLLLAYSFSAFEAGRITSLVPTLGNYTRFFGDFFYVNVILRTIAIGLIVTATTIVIAYPVAVYISHASPKWRGFLIQLVFLPLMVSVVVRAYGWMVILGRNGLVNATLLELGIVDEPLRLLFTPTAVVVALVEVLLPFMVMPLVASIDSIDRHVTEAARSVGATPMQAFWRVTFPLSTPGLVSGAVLVFSLSITAFAIPALLGGARVKMIASVAYDAMLVGNNWPFGSAIGIVMAFVSSAIILFSLRFVARRGG